LTGRKRSYLILNVNLYFSIKKLVAEREEEAEEVIRFMDAVTDIWPKF